ncbi:MAG TPA: energy transducer TonB [Dongiaceae bacterium]|nr:energy transducer TonB [Dongiaceae bacterium]
MAHQRRLLLLCSVLLGATFAYADNINRHLHDQYASKTLVLRGFYGGEHLRYDSSGSLISSNPSGDWTSDGFLLITHIGVKGHELKIKARRVSALFQNKTFILRLAENEVVRPHVNKAIMVEITADLGTKRPSPNQAEAAMERIFLSDKDDFVSLIPDFWKPCVPAGLEGKDKICHFAPETLAVLGVTTSGSDASTIANSRSGQNIPESAMFRVGKGVSPPKLTLHKEPEFSDLARRMKYQGVGVLGLTVNQEGVPTKVHVLNPLGCGLDAQAVRAVEGWRFQPAEKDGQPVAVEIAVEVNFHLY